jgi:flagellar FliL protein
MSTDTPTNPGAAPAPAAPGKKRRFLWIGLTIAVLMLGGGGAGYYWMNSHAAGEPEAEAEPAEPLHQAVIPFDSFVVNLADSGGSRFLRVSLSLVVDDEESAEALEDPVTKTRVRSAILELLAQQSAPPLITPDGKTALKQSIAEQTRKAAPKVQVSNVFFSEFIVQF